MLRNGAKLNIRDRNLREKGMKEMTDQRQKDFNTVWDWFVVNKKPQSKKDGFCYYDGLNGERCGYSVCLTAAELIEVVDERLNSANASEVINKLKIERHRVDTIFYCDIQRCHDWAHNGMGGGEGSFIESYSGKDNEPENFTKRMEVRLQAFAQYYSLEISKG